MTQRCPGTGIQMKIIENYHKYILINPGLDFIYTYKSP